MFKNTQKNGGKTVIKSERQAEILSILTRDGYATVESLSTIMGVSKSSIRRDLIMLEKAELVTRNYGGVELGGQKGPKYKSFNAQVNRRVEEKRAIAEKAAQLVEEKDIVFLDQSSVAKFLAVELIKDKKITIVTNNIEILSMDLPYGVTVYSSGGRVSSIRRCLIGEDVNSVFGRVRADFAFISAAAIAPDGMIYDNTIEDVTVRDAMMNNANKKVFLCDSEKFDTTASYRQCHLSAMDYMISEVDCKEKYQQMAPKMTIL